jgi:tRNA-dihydrouridine synthase
VYEKTKSKRGVFEWVYQHFFSMTLLLAPMEGLLDFTLHDILTRAGGIDRCLAEFCITRRNYSNPQRKSRVYYFQQRNRLAIQI